MRIALVSLLVSGIALAVAWTARPDSAGVTPRRTDRGDRVAALEREVENLRAQLQRMQKRETTANFQDGTRNGTRVSGNDVGDAGTGERKPARGTPEFAAMMEDAVDTTAKKVIEELALKQNKKPAIGAFAAALELSAKQRRETEKIVVAGQHRIHEALRIPTADGSSLMEEVVEIVARGVAEPGKDHGFGKWVQRVMSEKIPGTDETYGARIESVKNDMRASFKREWSDEQYREFEEWRVDPSEIQNVEGSPNAALMRRVYARARELGAKVPERN